MHPTINQELARTRLDDMIRAAQQAHQPHAAQRRARRRTYALVAGLVASLRHA